jgi:hypothetical protein
MGCTEITITRKKNAGSDKPFSVNKHVKERVNQWEMAVKNENN